MMHASRAPDPKQQKPGALKAAEKLLRFLDSAEDFQAISCFQGLTTREERPPWGEWGESEVEAG